jgi:L-fucose mutarotase
MLSCGNYGGHTIHTVVKTPLASLEGIEFAIGQAAQTRDRPVDKSPAGTIQSAVGRRFWIPFGETTMLNGVPPILSPELMFVLIKMGHGDELVLADGNFPADANAQRIVRADGHGVVVLLEAVLKFLPLDTFVEAPVAVMQPVDDDAAEPPIWGKFRELTTAAAGRSIELDCVDRFDFYERARNAYAIVATGETAIYANVILKKGVVAPE